MSNPQAAPEDLLARSQRLIDAGTISRALDDLALRLERELAQTGDWLLLPVLKGGMWTAMQLAQRLTLPMQMDYIHASRYRGATSGAELRWIAKPGTDISQKNVLLVDDIFDEGHTLRQISEWLFDQGAKQVISVALVSKQHDRGLSREWLDHAALEVPDEYIFGCGMDIQEYWRQLPEIRVYEGVSKSASLSRNEESEHD